ncbi:MAG: hypothetical protein IPL10_13070 [Bacteroidetes bacterium]|nr:hypothetical protein [Bacteroidota bacterium]
MDNRSEQLKNLRSVINVDNSKSTDLETFQTNTIRPILKFQNDLILTLINQHLAENKIVVKNLTDNKKTERIHEIVKGNLQLKQLLTGITIALFTEEEMNYYHENKKEVVKRTITILLERVCSQLQNLNF